MFDHLGRYPLGGLVEQEQLRVGHQRLGDRQHLPLTTGQRLPLLVAALGEGREPPGCPRHHGIGVLIAGCEGEVLLDGETGEDPFVLGDPDHARTVNPMARPTGDVTAQGAPSPSPP